MKRVLLAFGAVLLAELLAELLAVLLAMDWGACGALIGGRGGWADRAYVRSSSGRGFK